MACTVAGGARGRSRSTKGEAPSAAGGPSGGQCVISLLAGIRPGHTASIRGMASQEAWGARMRDGWIPRCAAIALRAAARATAAGQLPARSAVIFSEAVLASVAGSPPWRTAVMYGLIGLAASTAAHCGELGVA